MPVVLLAVAATFQDVDNASDCVCANVWIIVMLLNSAQKVVNISIVIMTMSMRIIKNIDVNAACDTAVVAMA